MSRPWTQPCVASAHMLQAMGVGLDQMAFTLSRTPADIDLCLWALAGRSIPEAVATLNRPAVVADARAAS